MGRGMYSHLLETILHEVTARTTHCNKPGDARALPFALLFYGLLKIKSKHCSSILEVQGCTVDGHASLFGGNIRTVLS